jgi:hypothetical protein
MTLSSWEFNKLNVYNYNCMGKLSLFFKYLNDLENNLPIFEAGVYKGRQTIALSMFLAEQGKKNRVAAIDTFSGFPDIYHEYDDVAHFQKLHASGLIDDDHLGRVQKNIQILSILGEHTTPELISTSGRFDGQRNLDLIKVKLDFLALENVDFYIGEVKTLQMKKELPDKVAGGIIDLDLFESYQAILQWIKGSLISGGLVYLDEYYSIKFPGAFQAVNEFLEENRDFDLIRFDDGSDFPRYYLQRVGP